MNEEFYDRINLNFELSIISKKICQTYNLGEYIEEKLIEVGYEDFNFIINTSNGKYCVKIFNKDRTNNDIDRYVKRIEAFNNIDINIPKVIELDKKIMTTITINNIDFKLVVFEFINGSSFYDLKQKPTEKEVENIIFQMSKIHKENIKLDYTYDKWTILNFKKEYEDKKNHLKDEYKSKFEKFIEDLEKVEMNKLSYSLVHGDIISSNVMKDKNNKLWVIDFSVANYMPSIVDLAVTSCNLCLNPNSKEETIKNIRLILNEYQKYNKLSEYELDTFKLFYNLANAIGIIQISYLSALGETSEEDEYWLSESIKGLSFNNEEFWKNILN